MPVYGLIGFPLLHSFSKDYFTTKFKKNGIDAEYVNFEIEDIPPKSDFIDIFSKHLAHLNHPYFIDDLKGFNVTIPHKRNIIPLLNEISKEALTIGAVNTVKVTLQNGEIHLSGHNTDIVGFSTSIQPLLKSHHTNALIFGTGGASAAIEYALKQIGIHTNFVSRDKNRAKLTYSDINKQIIAEHKILINCTPLGTFPNVNSCVDIPYQHITPEHLAYDLVYNPAKTLFLNRCEQQGATIKNGAEMLTIQAEESWKIWNS